MGIYHVLPDLFCGELSGEGGTGSCRSSLGHLTGVDIG